MLIEKEIGLITIGGEDPGIRFLSSHTRTLTKRRKEDLATFNSSENKTGQSLKSFGFV